MRNTIITVAPPDAICEACGQPCVDDIVRMWREPAHQNQAESMCYMHDALSDCWLRWRQACAAEHPTSISS